MKQKIWVIGALLLSVAFTSLAQTKGDTTVLLVPAVPYSILETPPENGVGFTLHLLNSDSLFMSFIEVWRNYKLTYYVVATDNPPDSSSIARILALETTGRRDKDY